MTREELQEGLTELLKDMDASDLIQVHNEYCEQCNMMDDMIYNNDDEFFNECYYERPIDAVRACYYGDYNYADDYIQFNGYGNLETFNEYNINDYIYIDDIVEYIIDNDDELYNDDIRELLDEYEESGEDEEQLY